MDDNKLLILINGDRTRLVKYLKLNNLLLLVASICIIMIVIIFYKKLQLMLMHMLIHSKIIFIAYLLIPVVCNDCSFAYNAAASPVISSASRTGRTYIISVTDHLLLLILQFLC